MICVHREKISKDKQRFIDRFGQDPRRLQLLFLSDAETSCEQILKPGGRQPGNCPHKISKICSVVRWLTASSYNHFASPKISTCCRPAC